MLGATPGSLLLHRTESTGEVLHVVADLVRDHVGLREIARRVEAALQVVEEREVDVEPLVIGTIERSHRRLADPAPGSRAAGVEHEPGRAVARARRLEDIAPHVLGAAEDLRDELPHRIRGHAFARRGLVGAWRRGLLHGVEHLARIEAEEGRDDRDDHAADAQAAAEADAAPVLDVAARPLAAKVHARLTGMGRPSSPAMRRRARYHGGLEFPVEQVRE